MGKEELLGLIGLFGPFAVALCIGASLRVWDHIQNARQAIAQMEADRAALAEQYRIKTEFNTIMASNFAEEQS